MKKFLSIKGSIILGLLVFFVLLYTSIEQNSFLPISSEMDLSEIITKKNFSFNPLATFGIFRAENGEFFLYFYDNILQKVYKFCIFFGLGFFIFSKFFQKFSLFKILTFGFFLSFLLASIQIIILFFSYFCGYFYAGVFSVGEILLTFFGYILGVFVSKLFYKIFCKNIFSENFPTKKSP